MTSGDEAQDTKWSPHTWQIFRNFQSKRPTQITLRAWLLTPNQANANAVILLHGLSDNRVGMTGYAELLLNHHYTILQPDARAHGAS